MPFGMMSGVGRGMCVLDVELLSTRRQKIIVNIFSIVDYLSISQPTENSGGFLVVRCVEVISIQLIAQTASARVLYLGSWHTFTVQSHLEFCNLYHRLTRHGG